MLITINNMLIKLIFSDNTIIDEIDFLNVFNNKEESISKAKNWEKNLKGKNIDVHIDSGHNFRTKYYFLSCFKGV